MKEIIKRISERSPQMISYADFIEFALYEPEYGYYMKAGEKVGRGGDFITTSNISDVYGRLLAKYFLKLTDEWQLDASVCEIGAGTGRFAAAFIAEWEKLSTKPLQYYIVETSPYHRKKQRELIHFNEQFVQVETLEELKPFSGLIFSNELFDALPVHVIEKRQGELREVMVAVEENQLIEKQVPLKNKSLAQFLEKRKIHLDEGQRFEIPLAMEKVLARIADVLHRGFVITVDYGYTDQEWMEPIHRDGSLRGYYKHEQVHDVLKNVGEMDITSHVHFDALIEEGEEVGLQFVSKQRQDEFFLSIGILEELENHYDSNPFSAVSKKNRALRSLIMPGGISSYFHTIIQKKGLDK